MKITRISVDESLVTLQDAARIARDALAEVFGIKLNRVGGLTKARRLRDIALAHGSGARCTDGYITVGERPGLGVEPDENLLGDPVAIHVAEP